ncbi:MAG: hypothetical protein ABGX16_06005 [Pirellulales bacterium]
MAYLRIRYMVTIASLVLVANTPSQATLTYFANDPVGWTQAVGNAGHSVELFNTGPDNIALSNEVDSPPADDSDLVTAILTFDKTNTPLSGSFTFETGQQPEQGLFYRLQLTGDLHPGDKPDAIEVNITGGQSVYAFALEIFDLEPEDGVATVEIFAGTTSLGLTSDLARDPDTFFGVLSDEPFDRIIYSGTVDQQESFSDFRFAFAPGCSSGLPGDFNCDQRVNDDDLTLWNQSFGLDDGADADGDGDSDGGDFLIWQQNHGTDLNTPALAVVPEPAAIGLLLLGFSCLAWPQSQRRDRLK